MTASNHFRVWVALAAVALAVGLLALVEIKPAEAAFPGANGRIVFQSNRDAGAGEIYSMKPDGSDMKRLTFTGSNTEPAYSPDGSRIAFISGRDSQYEIYVMNANGTNQRRLTNSGVTEQNPVWSPDGTRILFEAPPSGTNNRDIWVMNADGTGKTNLTNNPAIDGDPAWSPDGTKIAFNSAGRPEQFNQDIYVMNADGSGQTNITPNTTNPDYQGHDAFPAWFQTQNGTKIAYEHGHDALGGGLPDIWTMDPNGAGKTNVSNNDATSDTMPAWSPDGTKVAYVGTVSGTTNRDIYTMNADGTGQGPTHSNPAFDQKPDWQPLPVCTKSGTGTISGTPGKDVLCGSAGDDTINGGGGNDIILGQGGKDRLIGGLGNDTINGGPGTDTALYSGSTPVIANLATEFAKGVGLDVLLSVENLTGSGANDRLTGSAVANMLVGGAGADNMFGLAGNDTVNSKDGVRGNDSLSGGPGTDTKTTDATERSIVGFP